MGGPTGFLTLDTSEWPSVGAVSSLSLAEVLEEPSPRLERYFLSARASARILRRVEEKGKVLPHALKAALETLAGPSTTPTTTTRTGSTP